MYAGDDFDDDGQPEVAREDDEGERRAAPSMFGIEAVERDIARGQGHVSTVACANNLVFCGTSGGSLLRFDFAEGSASDVEVPKPGSGASVHRVFIDPTGTHALVVLVDSIRRPLDTLYLHASARKCRPVAKLKAVGVTAVAWNRAQGSPQTTGSIIVGSSVGNIYEVALDEKDKRERIFRFLFEVRDKEPVRGVYQDLSPGGPVAPGQPRAAGGSAARLALLIATQRRLYFFSGGPNIDAVVSLAVSPQGLQGPEPIVDLPARTRPAELHVYGKFPEQPLQFAWLAGPGVYHGTLRAKGPATAAAVLPPLALLEHSLLPFPPGCAPAGVEPLSLAVVPFHFALLYGDRLVFVNTLSRLPAVAISLQRVAPPLSPDGYPHQGLSTDDAAGVVYLSCGDALHEIVSRDPGRDIWRLYLERGDYPQALEHTRSQEDAEAVHLAQAEAAFAAGDLLKAAAGFSRAGASVEFEEVTLKLMSAGGGRPLRTYLRGRLDALTDAERAQGTLLATLLAELYLHALAEAESGSARGPDGASAASLALARGRKPGISAAGARPEVAADLAKEFRQFLSDNKGRLDEATTRRLLWDFGREDELIYYADLRGDFTVVVSHHLAKGDAQKAIQVLRRPGVPPELYYTFAPQLLALSPTAAVDAWIAAGDALEARRLVPALMRPDREEDGQGQGAGAPVHSDGLSGAGRAEARAQAIRFLHYCIDQRHNRDKAVHNLLLSLLTDTDDDEKEGGLLRFIQSGTQGSLESAFFDPAYALRLCLARGKRRAAVALLTNAGAFTEAVELALQVDLALAKATADKPEDDPALRRALWLRCAHHVIKQAQEAGPEGSPLRRAIDFLSETDGLLRIEDVLPFFPDVTKIDDFKEAVCASLEEYNAQISQLRQEMAEATSSAEAIRKDIGALSKRSLTLPKDTCCAKCSNPLVSARLPHGPKAAGMSPFYVFPCGMAFEPGCLVELFKSTLGTAQAARGTRALRLWNQLLEGEVAGRDADTARAVLEDLICGECPYCGDMMISIVSLPFVDGVEEAELTASWEV